MQSRDEIQRFAHGPPAGPIRFGPRQPDQCDDDVALPGRRMEKTVRLNGLFEREPACR
jgi:hypothetical protein